MKKSVYLLMLLLLSAMLYSCSTVYLTPPSSGRSAIDQTLLTQAIDISLANVEYGPLQGKNVVIEVGDAEADNVVNDYVKAQLAYNIVNKGGIVVDSFEQADSKVIGIVKTAGTDRNGPNSLLALLFKLLYSTKFKKGFADITVIAYDTKQSSQPLINSSNSAKQTYRQFTILGLLGPFTTSDLKANCF